MVSSRQDLCFVLSMCAISRLAVDPETSIGLLVLGSVTGVRISLWYYFTANIPV
jgi:hypothetical protein